MPTYDYRCKGCGHAFELFQTMGAGVKRKCPECGEPKLERLIGMGAGVVFKGSGFYETDYRSKSYSEGAKQEKAAKEGPKDSGKKESGAKGEAKQADASKSTKKDSK